MVRGLLAEDALGRHALSPLELLVLEEVHDRADLGEFERRVVDEEVQHALPEVLVLQHLAQPGGEDRTGQCLPAAQATHLRPAEGGDGREVVRCLAEQVGHRPGEAERQAGGADVPAEAQVLVPAVLRQDFAGRQVEPDGGHEGRDRVTGEQVVGEGGKLRPGALRRREPCLDGPQPVGVVKGQGQQAGVEGIAVVAGTVRRDAAGWSRPWTCRSRRS